MTRLHIVLDGRDRVAEVDERLLLVEALRESFDAKAPKIGCLTGDCGACTVVIDGCPTKSCLELAVAAQGAVIRTTEGLASESGLTDIQQAFVTSYAFQCGYCLPGMLHVAEHLLDTTGDPSEGEIREALRGNLCRCTGYDNIVDAIGAVARDRAEREQV